MTGKRVAHINPASPILAQHTLHLPKHRHHHLDVVGKGRLQAELAVNATGAAFAAYLLKYLLRHGHGAFAPSWRLLTWWVCKLSMIAPHIAALPFRRAVVP